MTGAAVPGPSRYRPMLATPWPAPFSDPDWAFELKWDGMRALLYVDANSMVVRSRTDRDVTRAYPELSGVRMADPHVLDGEIVALDGDGRPSFELLQSRINLSGAARVARAAGEVPVHYILFDVLYAGREVTALPWRERRRILEALDLPSPLVLTDVVDGDGEDLWEAIVARSLEGMVGKRTASPYRPGERSADWRKVAFRHTARAVVGGFTPGRGSRAGSFGALLLGLFEGGSLRYIGSVGTGFDGATRAAIRATLDTLAVSRSPFLPDPALPGGAVWVAPHLVAAVEHKGWTAAGRLRAASFGGAPAGEPVDATWEAEGPGTTSFA